MMVTTGDQDMCYYNFACAYPYHLVVDFSDFNHFFSNIGYIVLGTIFIFITLRRDYILNMKMRRQKAIEVSRLVTPPRADALVLCLMPMLSCSEAFRLITASPIQWALV